MINLPKLPRSILRDENKPEYAGRPLWQPRWKCFCCHDSGIVNPHLAALVVSGYDPDQDKIPLCQNPHCNAGDRFLHSQELEASLDMRFTSTICQQLDAFHREDWRQCTQQQFERVINIQEIARSCSMRKGDRTSSETMLADQKHQEVLARMEDERC
jgi:hypothetical protein